MSGANLSGLWRSIELAGALGAPTLRFLDTGVVFPTGTALVGLDGAGERHLCIPSSVDELGCEDKRSLGVSIEVRPLRDAAGKESPFVDVHCHRPDLNPVFEIVASEILKSVEAGTDSPFRAAHTVLERWRDLLEPSGSGLLGPQQLAALLAELLLLERLGAGGPPPLASWLGPDKGPHDFVCGAVDFEVKSTLTTTGREVQIHGLSQLTASPGSMLYLWWARLRPSPGRGFTVPSVVEALLARGCDSSILLKKLSLMGYKLSDAGHYQNTPFELVESSLYAVDAAFPKLTVDSFTDGLHPQVRRVDYSISLDAATPVPLSPMVADTIFKAVG